MNSQIRLSGHGLGKRLKSGCVAGLLFLLAPAIAAADTAFTYQGELTENGVPANGTFDIEFSLWDADVGGNQICCPVVVNDVQVMEGRFNAQLDFGADAFDNQGRWLELIVEGFTLSPRQPITRAPYSIQTRGIFVDENQNVGIGTTTPNATLDVNGLAAFENATFAQQVNFGGGARLNGGGLIVDGPSSGGPTDHSVSIYAITDGDSLRSINDGNGKAARFEGDVVVTRGNIGIGNADPPYPLTIESNSASATVVASNLGSAPVMVANGTSDATLGGTDGLIIAGQLGENNLAIDGNEIMARLGRFSAPLYLNKDGGDIVCGGAIDISYSVVTGGSEAICPAGTRVLSGGCRITGDAEVRASYPSGDAWHCEAGDAVGFIEMEAYAICANVK